MGINAVYQAATVDVAENNYIKVNVPASHKITVSVNDYNRTCNFYNGTTKLGSLSGTGDYSYTNDTEDGITVTIAFAASKNDYKTVALKTVVVEDVSGLPYTVNAVDGEGSVITEITSGFAKSGDDVNITGINQVVSKDGVYYELNDDAVTTYGKSFVMPATTTTFNVSYKVASDIVYFIEGEKISQAKNSDTHSGGAYSQYIVQNNATAHKTLNAGVYSLYVRFGEKITANRAISPFLGSTSGERLATITQQKDVELATTPDGEVPFTVITDNSDIVFGNNANGASVDYLIIRRTGDLPASVIKSITSAGWATYCSPYNLDFSSAIENLDAAYIVTGGTSGVLTKTEVTGAVPAGTGLLLKGNGECAIPVATSSNFDVTANKLEGKTAEYELAAEGGYVLMNDATNGLGFYLNSNSFTVGANTAYLPAGFDASGARPTFFWFGDDTTDINSVQNSGVTVNGCYNLNGQRAAQPTKGLYIVNGKKVIK